MQGREVCPFEWRYGSRDMRIVFSEQNRLATMAKVETALLRGLARAGVMPEGVDIPEPVITSEDVARIRGIEGITGHETAALARLLAEKLGKAGAYVHLGATSNDIIDTAWSLMIRDALRLVESKTARLIGLLIDKADTHVDTVMIGRTHGQHALPITLGFKLMNHAYELAGCLERLMDSHRRLFVLKMSGAVGTMAAWGDKGAIVEEHVSRELGLRPVEISTQIYSRDRFAELVCSLAILGSVLDRLATEIRNLQRPEISELAEPFGERQVGSSTMPHKMNPVKCEKVSGLARFLRGLCSSALENIVLWHERDLSNSSLERIVIPHAFLTIDEMLDAMLEVMEGLRVFPDRMRENLEASRGLFMAEALVVKLVSKGMPRQEAYELVRSLAMKSVREGRPFKELVLEDPVVSSLLGREEVLDSLDYARYLGLYRDIYRRARRYVLSVLDRHKNCWAGASSSPDGVDA